jgi:ATP-dependent exoDNAse (exonuclease V) beta subunit
MNALALEQNLVLSAGAGTGKTYNLMTLALHLLGGARSAGALPVEQLCIVTFTEKAAAQLSERLRLRVERLCDDESAPEPELRESFAALGQIFPLPPFWRGIRDRLDRAQIGTFHGMALRWLRRLNQRGLVPAAELLDEESAATLLEESIERTVVAQLDSGNEAVAQLCRDLGFSSSGWASGLVEELMQSLLSAREEGVPLDQLPVGNLSDARAVLDEALKNARGAVKVASVEDTGNKFRDLLGAIEDHLASEDVERLDVLAGQTGRGKLLRPVKGALEQVIEAHAAWSCVPLEIAFRALLHNAAQTYRQALRDRNVMDFAELLERVRDLWRDVPDARREAQARVGALLVDEFQDTNRVQLQLVTLLAEEREGGPRPVSQGVLDLPLQPGFLAIVGDRKQSIYEFRGADVSLFEVLAKKIDASGGQRAFLQRSHRSAPALVEFFNQGFGAWMRAQGEAADYEVAFSENDCLEAVRVEDAPEPVRLLEHAAANRSAEARIAEARALALELRRVLDTPLPDGSQRRGGEIALLLRRFTHLEIYRQALQAAGVKHQVWRERGFFAAPEIRDAEALLSWICDPQDVTSLAALLRSPFVGLSDGALWAVAQACGGKLSGSGLRAKDLEAESLTDWEKQRLRQFLSLEARWRAARDQLDARQLLEEALDETGYRTAAALGAYSDQILTNLERLLEQASRSAAAGGTLADFAVDLRRRMAKPSPKTQAELGDAVDPDAVQILTVHQAKGLEWPVVVVGDLNAPRFRRSGRVVFERRMGLALRSGNGAAPGAVSSRFQQLSAERLRREQAEELRLFYVALTRARDALWLSGSPLPSSRPASGGWSACVEGLHAQSIARWVTKVAWEEPLAPVQIQVLPTGPTPEAIDDFRTQVARVRRGRL